jgi:23S rRNA (pseudouridine1915-N3)-methyltransferase
MKFEFLFLGKTKDKYLEEGITKYCKRLKHYTPLSVKILKTREKKNWSELQCMENEAKTFKEVIPKGAIKIALDSTGKQFSSEELAVLIGNLQKRGARQVNFIIGGAFGLHKDLLNDADEIISLSKMTFTHDMVRLFLMEQVYRAFTIRNNEKYHK